MMESSTRRRIFLAVSAVLAVTVMVLAHAVMLPFILALVVAYVLTPAVRRVEGPRVPRWAAILIVYAITLGGVGGFVAVIVPRLVAEGQALASEWPNLTRDVREKWLPAIDARLLKWSRRDTPPSVVPADPDAPPLPPPAPILVERRPDGSFEVRIREGVQVRESGQGVWRVEQVQKDEAFSSAKVLRGGFDKAVAYLRENTAALLEIGRVIVATISRGIFNLFMTLMLGGYIILTHERVLDFFRDLWPPGGRDSFDRFMRRLDRGLSGVVRGQLIICLVNGVLSAIGFWLFDLKYWPILSIVAAVMSLIPIFGSILSSIPAVAIGLTQSPGTAVGVLAWIVGIHQLEANFLNPKIIGDAAKIHPVLVVFSLLVGEHFFQIAGALFAVPCMSIAQTIFLHFRESTMGLADPLASIPPPPRSLKTPQAIPVVVATPISPVATASPVPSDDPPPDTARAG